MRALIAPVLALALAGGALAQPAAEVVPEPELAAIASPSITPPAWTARPSSEDYRRYYPPGAFASGVSGRVVLECIVSREGQLSCSVISETPANFGFGAAAVRISQHFRVAPATQDGHATAGGRIRVPIRFEVD